MIEGRYLNVAGISYAVSPDAERFLLLKEREQPTPTHINIVTNWFEELKRLVPTN